MAEPAINTGRIAEGICSHCGAGTAASHFCADCGTGLFYYNAVNLPGIADVQIATLDDPGAVAPMIHVQAAERLAWMERAHELPAFDRYPSRG